MAFFLLASSAFAIYVMADKGAHGSQLYFFGGAPMALSGLPAKPAPGQVGFADVNYEARLEQLATSLYLAEEKLMSCCCLLSRRRRVSSSTSSSSASSSGSSSPPSPLSSVSTSCSSATSLASRPRCSVVLLFA